MRSTNLLTYLLTYLQRNSKVKRSKVTHGVTLRRRNCAKSLITSQRVVRFWSNLVQSMTTWHSIYNERSSSRGQRSRSQRDI